MTYDATGAVRGFKLLVSDKQVATQRYSSDIVNIAYGHSSGWALRIEVKIRSYLAWITFPDPISFRVQDEREMTDYWLARAAENVPIGLLYSIAHSPYLGEFSSSIAAMHQPLTHFLVTGNDACVEVLTHVSPTLPTELIQAIGS